MHVGITEKVLQMASSGQNSSLEDQNEFKGICEDHDGWFLEMASLETPISEGSLGHKLLAKHGWKSGQGLGKDLQGRVEPVPFVLKSDIMGFGLESLENLLAEQATERCRLMSDKRTFHELQETHEVQEKQKLHRGGLEETKSSLYCELCGKQYHEDENHMNSPDHKQCLKDLKDRDCVSEMGVIYEKGSKHLLKAEKKLDNKKREHFDSGSPENNDATLDSVMRLDSRVEINEDSKQSAENEIEVIEINDDESSSSRQADDSDTMSIVNTTFFSKKLSPHLPPLPSDIPLPLSSAADSKSQALDVLDDIPLPITAMHMSSSRKLSRKQRGWFEKASRKDSKKKPISFTLKRGPLKGKTTSAAPEAAHNTVNSKVSFTFTTKSKKAVSASVFQKEAADDVVTRKTDTPPPTDITAKLATPELADSTSESVASHPVLLQLNDVNSESFRKISGSSEHLNNGDEEITATKHKKIEDSDTSHSHEDKKSTVTEVKTMKEVKEKSGAVKKSLKHTKNSVRNVACISASHSPTTIENSSIDRKENFNLIPEGPKLPTFLKSANVLKVMTFDGVSEIEWPITALRYTKSKPSLSYSCNEKQYSALISESSNLKYEYEEAAKSDHVVSENDSKTEMKKPTKHRNSVSDSNSNKTDLKSEVKQSGKNAEKGKLKKTKNKLKKDENLEAKVESVKKKKKKRKLAAEDGSNVLSAVKVTNSKNFGCKASPSSKTISKLAVVCENIPTTEEAGKNKKKHKAANMEKNAGVNEAQTTVHEEKEETESINRKLQAIRQKSGNKSKHKPDATGKALDATSGNHKKLASHGDVISVSTYAKVKTEKKKSSLMKKAPNEPSEVRSGSDASEDEYSKLQRPFKRNRSYSYNSRSYSSSSSHSSTDYSYYSTERDLTDDGWTTATSTDTEDYNSNSERRHSSSYDSNSGSNRERSRSSSGSSRRHSYSRSKSRSRSHSRSRTSSAEKPRTDTNRFGKIDIRYGKDLRSRSTSSHSTERSTSLESASDNEKLRIAEPKTNLLDAADESIAEKRVVSEFLKRDMKSMLSAEQRQTQLIMARLRKKLIEGGTEGAASAVQAELQEGACPASLDIPLPVEHKANNTESPEENSSMKNVASSGSNTSEYDKEGNDLNTKHNAIEKTADPKYKSDVASDLSRESNGSSTIQKVNVASSGTPPIQGPQLPPPPPPAENNSPAPGMKRTIAAASSTTSPSQESAKHTKQLRELRTLLSPPPPPPPPPLVHKLPPAFSLAPPPPPPPPPPQVKKTEIPRTAPSSLPMIHLPPEMTVAPVYDDIPPPPPLTKPKQPKVLTNVKKDPAVMQLQSGSRKRKNEMKDEDSPPPPPPPKENRKKRRQQLQPNHTVSSPPPPPPKAQSPPPPPPKRQADGPSFVIPPDQVEQYKILQQQAQLHAQRQQMKHDPELAAKLEAELKAKEEAQAEAEAAAAAAASVTPVQTPPQQAGLIPTPIPQGLIPLSATQMLASSQAAAGLMMHPSQGLIQVSHSGLLQPSGLVPTVAGQPHPGLLVSPAGIPLAQHPGLVVPSAHTLPTHSALPHVIHTASGHPVLATPMIRLAAPQPMIAPMPAQSLALGAPMLIRVPVQRIITRPQL